ncbi:MAG: hypothetical protein JWO15_1601 [Sphingomonadales bacterium]|nr:hypothetical protein [Sphingomonadales bacterium]
MHNIKLKWRGDRGSRALKRVGDIETSIIALDDEDLLDLHDIFAGSPTSTMAIFASDEMQRRNITG